MLRFGYWGRMKVDGSTIKDFRSFVKSYNSKINWDNIYESNYGHVYVCYDSNCNKVVAVMEVSKEREIIYAIESRERGRNLAMTMITHFEKKFKCKLQPDCVLLSAKGFWEKHGYIIDKKI
jgi:hypothetical protein